MSDEPIRPETRQQARQDIQRLFREIAELSKQDLPVEDYFGRFLSAVLTALSAAGGAVWRGAGAGEAELICQNNLRATEIAEGGDDELRHMRLLQQIMQQGESLIVPPYSGNDRAGNPTRFLLILVPLRSDDAPAADDGDNTNADGVRGSSKGTIEGVVEIFQRPGAPVDVQRGYLNFLHGVCDKASDWMRRRKYRQLSQEQARWRQLDELSQAIHESLHPRETAFALANEARQFIGCDRVSVATRRGGTFRLEAVSGHDSVDRRSNLIVLLERLVRRVLAAGDPFWFLGTTDDVPPQIEEACQEYVDVAHSRSIGVVPLRKPPKPAAESESRDSEEAEIVGALIVEQIEDSTAPQTVQQRTAQVAVHAERAVANAQAHDSLFLMPLWRLLGHSRVLVAARNLPKTLTVGILLLVALVACLVVPIRFELEGAAELQPMRRRNVFAGIDGVVTEVHVDTGDPVEVGTKLLTLRNTELVIQIEDLQGRLSVVNEQILEYERRLLGSGTVSPPERARWASELAGLRKERANYVSQLVLLREREKELTIESPIAGEVITWDARRLLHNRPVAPGQVLLTVADPSGPWELLIHMPEDNIGYITEAQAQLGNDLDVSYILATNPGKKYAGTLRRVHPRAEPHETAGHSVKIAVDIDEDDLSHPRPGATATAQVDCGRRSIAFVWLHDVLEFLQTKVFF